jgi:Tat protein translocase TatB subunit
MSGARRSVAGGRGGAPPRGGDRRCGTLRRSGLDIGVVFNLGMSEIVVILVVALVFLGPKKLPELASGIGKMIRELRKATSDIKNEIQLDETISKPMEELREAMTLHPEELKRRDLEKAARQAREKAEREEEAKRKAAEEAAAAKAPEAAAAKAPAAAAPSPLSPPVTSNGDKTIVMPPPGFSGGPARTPSGSVPAVKVPGTVARPTLVGVAPSPTVPRPAPPPVPSGAAKLPPPSSAARPIPAPPVKKD